MDIYGNLRELARSIRGQNLFLAAKELSNIQIFKNRFNFSKLQDIYISFLYMYETINRDIILDNISKKIYDCELYEDCYMLWKRQNTKKKEESKDKNKDLHLVGGKEIVFPKEDK